MNQNNLTEFPQEVIEELKYYVYRLIDPRNGSTFYIGKGKGNRVFQHMKAALTAEEANDLSNKIQTIREINVAGLDVIHVIHRHGMDEKTAFELEAAMIDDHPEVTNIMGGSGSNDYGPMNAVEIMNKYAAEDAIFEHRCLMITINKSYADRGTYNATRIAWKLSKKKVKEVEYVLAVIQGMIIEVYKPTKWMEATVANFSELPADSNGRMGFVGTKAESEIRELYVRKRIPQEYRKRGAANPVKYSF